MHIRDFFRFLFFMVDRSWFSESILHGKCMAIYKNRCFFFSIYSYPHLTNLISNQHVHMSTCWILEKNEESVLRSLPHAYVSNYNYIILSNFKDKHLANASVDRDGLVPC